MSYGACHPAECPACGWGAAEGLTVVDYTVAPPPIPMIPDPDVFLDDRHVMFCPECDEELDGSTLLDAANRRRLK